MGATWRVATIVPAGLLLLAWPAAAQIKTGGGGMTVEASWNGATAVSSWAVLAGATAASMSVVATVPRAGFETSVSLSAGAPLVAVAALGAGGETLAAAAAISPSG